MRDSKRFERGFPPLAKEGQGGFEHASQNPPQSLFQRGKLLSRRTIIFGLGLGIGLLNFCILPFLLFAILPFFSFASAL